MRQAKKIKRKKLHQRLMIIIFEAILISGIYRNLLKIMLRQKRRDVNFKPNRRYVYKYR